MVMITITTIGAIMGTIVATVTLSEKALHSRSKIKALLSSDDQPLLVDLVVALSSRDKEKAETDKEIIEGIYKTLDKSKPIVEAILRRIYRRYLVGLFLALVVAFPV